MENRQLEQVINQLLQVQLYKDFSPNGLQVEGQKEVKKIVTGVTACQLLLDEAVKLKADAILVHHGYFWKNEPVTVTGIKYKRLKTLLNHNINLYGYHLPLDGHPSLGNNILLAEKLGITVDERPDITNLLFQGSFATAITAEQLQVRIENVLNRPVLFCGDNAPTVIKRVAWCSGGGQDFIEEAALLGFDAFITGEVSERTIHIAREYGINFYAAGHHATERYGIEALGQWLAENYDLDVTFVDIDNPA